jgi:Rrf2 family iron-sulfur cluster assembly transcriptional regulator
MILTSKARYAVTAIIELASSKDKQPLALSLIAKKQNISLFYLEQIFSKLKKSALVEAVKGPKGGYILVKNPSEISIATIIKAIGEPIKMTRCTSNSKACNSLTSKTKCKTHHLWQGLENKIHEYLDSINLQDL